MSSKKFILAINLKQRLWLWIVNWNKKNTKEKKTNVCWVFSSVETKQKLSLNFLSHICHLDNNLLKTKVFVENLSLILQLLRSLTTLRLKLELSFN